MEGWFINLGPSSTTIREANADIKAILGTNPDFLVGVEAIAKGALPTVEPYFKIRERHPEGRANVFAYVKGGQRNYQWTDCKVKFPRSPGTPGLHPARSFVTFNYRLVQFTVAHHPPEWPGAGPARVEHEQRLQETLAPWTDEKQWRHTTEQKQKLVRNRSRILLWDRNMPYDEAMKFARSVDGWVVGDLIDCAITRNLTVISHGYQRQVQGHHFATDHPWGAFHIQFTVN